MVHELNQARRSQMCGIIAYVGHRPAISVLIEGLHRLEYRGYDSAGVAVVQNKQLVVVKAAGKLANLENKLAARDLHHATIGLGHTRWATHGLPSEENAHPHQDGQGRLALVHNGIIENFLELKQELLAAGCCFKSETDTEALVHLISRALQDGASVLEALQQTVCRVDGSYALALVDLKNAGQIWAARHSSPLLMGIGTGEVFFASDIPAFLPYTREVVFLEDGEIAQADAGKWQVFSGPDLQPIEKKVHSISWDVQSAQKGGFKHFMLKEIMEQPQVIRNCLSGRVRFQEGILQLPELSQLTTPNRIHIVACGTSYHAGLWAKYLIERWSHIPVQIDIASEFRYRSPILRDNDLVVAVSQSGETADTLAGIAIAKEMGVPVLGLCNVVGSSVARESDAVLYTQAGPEISVASTKAMCSQMVGLLLLALYWGKKEQILSKEVLQKVINGLDHLPDMLETDLPRLRERAKELIKKYSEAQSFFYLGRGLYFPLALEGALKLKEISYIHAEGYAAGEMKHGPIALIDPGFPTFALTPDDALLPKVLSNLKEVQARGGPIIALTHPGVDTVADDRWLIAKTWGPLNSFLMLSALQLFAYEMAVYLGKDVDQPRNLAKSVTVE